MSAKREEIQHANFFTLTDVRRFPLNADWQESL